MEQETKKVSRLKEAWDDTQKRHNILFICFVLLIGIVIGGYFLGKVIIRGKNLIAGSWTYEADIVNYGDSDYTMHLTSDYNYYLNSEYATNYGTYTITNGGESGNFYTDIEGVITKYSYRISDDRETLFLTVEGSSEHTLTKIHTNENQD